MPELPEVETCKNGILPHLLHKTIETVTVRNDKLRWPIAKNLPQLLCGQTVHHIYRRAKYIILQLETGSLIVHLGMSGHIKIVDCNTPVQKHDHLDIIMDSKLGLRYNDPRRFGSILWTQDNPNHHVLLKKLGPEPLSDEFNAIYLLQQIHKRRQGIKKLLMDQQIVVGIGNIYANEALFLSKIHPLTPGQRLTGTQIQSLITQIRQTLLSAIQHGGTTLNDFKQANGKPGYFQQKLLIYNRAGQACIHCQTRIQKAVDAQRSYFFCPQCQSI